MKRIDLILAIFLAGISIGTAQEPLTTLREIAALSRDQAARRPTVEFEATVTYSYLPGQDMNLQDGDSAIRAHVEKDYGVVPGDRVLVRGVVEPSFLSYIHPTSITFLHHGELPKAVPANFSDLVHTQLNCRLVRVRGTVRAADVVASSDLPTGRLQLLTGQGYVDVQVDTHEADALRSLLDAQVEITGAAGRLFDAKRQQTGAKLKVRSLADIKILKSADASPWSLPTTSLGDIVAAYNVHDLSQRIRIHGTITYYVPGIAAVLENGNSSLWIATQTEEPLQIGDAADAIGFPGTDGLHLSLVHAEIRDTHTPAPVTPTIANWNQLASWSHNSLEGHEYDLASIEGRVISEVREAIQDEYVLTTSDGRLFTAIFHHPPAPASVPAMRDVPLGSTIRVTGICVVLGSTPLNGEAPFNILLRSFDDITVVAQPPWLNAQHISLIAAWLLIGALLLGARGWFLERKVRREIGSLAYVEQRRGRILESINSSEPLAEIVERVTELVSVRLNGAPCWCQVADGATLGNRPQQLASASLRTVEYPIAARTGPPLGTICAAFYAGTKPTAIEREALAMGAGLATLAIETSRLYSDLVRRSEFDVLTNVQNRFAMEKTLDAMIHNARQTASVFAMIFIDLNEFKQVNDLHGHLVGDLYLQEVAQRMTQQLRPSDTLARVGGDEFAVLVPDVRNRAEVDEIAMRLEACFADPFAGEGYVLRGSASIGLALYPEDANTADSLLSTADAAMYMAKYTKKRRDSMAESDQEVAPQRSR